MWGPTGSIMGVSDPPATSAAYLAPWASDTDIPEAQKVDLAEVDLAFMLAAATDCLYVLSGRQYRSGRLVVRPVSIQGAYSNQSYLYPYSSMSGYGSAWGFAAGWAWAAIGMGWWQNGQDLSECVLQGPVTRINSVMVNGEELGPWEPGLPANPNYTLYDKRRLVRMVGTTGSTTGAWPWNQQLNMNLDQPGTWGVDYQFGQPPPPMGRLACIELAVELARTLSNQSGRLPARVQSVVTQGVSTAVGDALTFIKESLTGLPTVDLFLQQANPMKRRRKAIFLAPNSTQGRAT